MSECYLGRVSGIALPRDDRRQYELTAGGGFKLLVFCNLCFSFWFRPSHAYYLFAYQHRAIPARDWLALGLSEEGSIQPADDRLLGVEVGIGAEFGRQVDGPL